MPTDTRRRRARHEVTDDPASYEGARNLICSHRLDLNHAQRAIGTDWAAALDRCAK